MKIKDIFKIILKIIGLYSLIDLIIQIPNLSYYIYYEMIFEVNWMILTVPIISLVIIYVLLFKPNIIIDLFKLDKGFDSQDITTNSFDGKQITKLALIIIAVYLIVFNIGDFIIQIIFSFKESVSRNSLDMLLDTIKPNLVNYQLMISSGIALLVGFILLTNLSRISQWIEKMNRKNIE